MTKPAHRRGSYARDAAAVRAFAIARPDVRCMFRCECRAFAIEQCTCGKACGLRLDQHQQTSTGKPPSWDAGHAEAGRVGGLLRPEVASCNRRGGGETSTARRKMKLRPTRNWYA